MEDEWENMLSLSIIALSRRLDVKKVKYNLFAIRDQSWYNWSVNYSYTARNMHFFGEHALDKKFSNAFVNGLLISVDPQIDVSVVHRWIAMRYQAVYGNAFTENTLPSNEYGLYTGVSLRITSSLKIDAYADIFKFPWLKSSVDAPAHGSEYLFQMQYIPNRNTELYIRYRSEMKPANTPGSATNYIERSRGQHLRCHFSYGINKYVSVRSRAELAWFILKPPKQEGWLIYSDVNWQPVNKPYAAILRLQFFEASDYDTRLYAYENDVLYSYSLPAFFDNGLRYYLLINYNWQKKIACWIKWAQTIKKDFTASGTGMDEIDGNKRSEIRVQVCYYINN